MRGKQRLVWLVVAVLGTITLGCWDAAGPGTGPELEIADFLMVSHHESGLLFIQRNEPAETSMDALYEGSVTLDEAGCLRADPDAGTPVAIVWPFGFDVRFGGDAIRIVDGDGEVFGTVGSDFELAGGLVDALHDGLGFTAADRALAEARCPGKFWVVADPGV